MKINLKILFSLPVILSMLSCKSSEDSGWFNADFYNNDKEKIASEIVDESLRCKFNPPLNWSFQSAELSRKIESKNKFQDAGPNSFSYSPAYLFFNESTGSLLSIGIVEYSDSITTIDNLVSNYKNLLSNKLRNDKLSIGSFTKSGIKFAQFKSEKESFVNYKIFFPNASKKLIQLDCTIRKDSLETELNYLKATIGSIELYR
ncbi:MAG: hypothetical protein RDU14_02900 [Melioribacteraceae bacterium]|nr:hypothetical protein [Melioribacteraceae bacterium]